MKTLILSAHAVSDYADGPDWVRIELTEGFLQRVEQLSALCLEHGLRSVTVHDGPAEWHLQDELRLSNNLLEVYGVAFWFSCYPKHDTYACESDAIGLGELRAAIEGGSGYGFIFEGDLVFQNKDVKEIYEEHLANLSQEQADE